MYEINEREFIGESLPKINSNFTDAENRLVSLETISTQYNGLSSFYSTHSNNSQIAFKTVAGAYNGSFELKKIPFVSGEVDVSKIIYPIPIYLNFYHMATDDMPVVTFFQKPSVGAAYSSVLSFRVPSARGSLWEEQSCGLYTLSDLGFYDWKLVVESSSVYAQITVNIKYLA